MNLLYRNKGWFVGMMLPLIPLLIISSSCGLFIKDFYILQSANWAAQSIAQDFINLALMVPVLVLSTVFMLRGSVRALFVWLGAMFYMVYTFVIYCFSLHFGSLFLVYCSVLGLSFYSIVLLFNSIDFAILRQLYYTIKAQRVASIYLIATAVIFFLLWLSEIVPALFHSNIPNSVKEAGLLTNPVYVLDLSFLLPGMFATAILLLKRHPLASLITPSLLFFSVVMALSIGIIFIELYLKGMTSDYAGAIVFAIVSLLSLAIFLYTKPFLKKE